MSRRPHKLKYLKEIVEDVEIMDISEDGRGIGKKDSEVFFIQGGVPEERVHIEVYGKRKSVKEATILETIQSSPLREKPFCEHFGECGGCKWQNLSYDGQLKFKEKQVWDALERIAKIPYEDQKKVWNKILPSLKTRYYRNKLEFTFSHRRWKSKQEIQENPDHSEFSPGLGFHSPGSFDKILDIEHCYLQEEPSNSIRNRIKEFCVQQNLPFFQLRDQGGLLRNLLIRTSELGETMVVVIFAYEDADSIHQVMEFIHQEFPSLHSLQYIINPKKNDTFLDQELILYKGEEYIHEQMGDLKFRISAKSFFQTNSTQAYRLYSLATELADFQGHELVYDLYTGTGTIANFLASKVKKVIGLEYVEDAILDARKNAEYNSITNAEFYAGDIKDLLSPDFTLFHGIPDIIITDPPRAGMHPDVIQSLIRTSAEKIIYISCNPSTQARDLFILKDYYDIISIRPVDMFPQTQHVENIVSLRLKPL